MDHANGRMVGLMLENTIKTKSMEKGYIPGQTVDPTSEDSKMDSSMGSVNSRPSLVKLLEKVNGLKEKETNGFNRKLLKVLMISES